MFRNVLGQKQGFYLLTSAPLVKREASHTFYVYQYTK